MLDTGFIFNSIGQSTSVGWAGGFCASEWDFGLGIDDHANFTNANFGGPSASFGTVDIGADVNVSNIGTTTFSGLAHSFVELTVWNSTSAPHLTRFYYVSEPEAVITFDSGSNTTFLQPSFFTDQTAFNAAPAPAVLLVSGSKYLDVKTQTSTIWFILPVVIQPLVCKMDKNAPAINGTLTSDKGTPSPNKVLCDGLPHLIKVSPGANLTITAPAPTLTVHWQFAITKNDFGPSVSVIACATGTCPAFRITGVELIKNTFQAASALPHIFDVNVNLNVFGSSPVVNLSICQVPITSGNPGPTGCSAFTAYNRPVFLTPTFPSTIMGNNWTATGPGGFVFIPTTGGNTFTAVYDYTILCPPATPPTQQITPTYSGTGGYVSVFAFGNSTAQPNIIYIGGKHGQTFNGAGWSWGGWGSGGDAFGSCSAVICAYSNGFVQVNSLSASVTFCHCNVSIPFAAGGGILGLDCGNCMVSDGKFYTFYGVLMDSNGTAGIPIDRFQFRFSDGFRQIAFEYDNLTQSVKALSGGDFITLGTFTHKSNRTATSVSLNVTINVALRPQIGDIGSTNAYMEGFLSNGANSSAILIQKGLEILGQGGAINRTYIQNGTAISGENPYSCLALLKGSCDVNATYFALQSYQTQFGVLLDAASCYRLVFNFCQFGGEPNFWQDKTHSGCGFACIEPWTAPGDWNATIHWFAWDGTTWVDLQHVTIRMAFGDQGTTDEWTTITAAWYNGNTLVKNDSVSAWIEQGAGNNPGSAKGQVRFYLDMWLSRDNGSTIHGGHLAAYYYGMQNSGFLFWNSWSPQFQNQSSSVAMASNRNSTGGLMSAQYILCSKIGWDISRQQLNNDSYYDTTADRNFSIAVHDFEIEKYVTATRNSMGGVGIPQFSITQVPNLPAGGLLAPLFSLLQGLAAAFWGALSAGLAAIWAAIGSQFPWFTAFFDQVYAGITAFFTLFLTVAPLVFGALTFIGNLLWLLTYPVQIIVNAFGWIGVMFGWLQGINLQSVAIILIILYGVLPFVYSLMEGDFSKTYFMIRQTWRIAERIMFYTVTLIRVVIDNIIGLIP